MGIDCFKVDELGLKCKFKPTSFHQVNNGVAEKLYKEVLKEVKGNTTINCYSGAGVLSGAIARNKKRVFGIELGKSGNISMSRMALIVPLDRWMIPQRDL